MIVKVKVKVNARENGVKREGETLIVKVKSRAEKGKANAELIKVLEEYYGKNVRIIKGWKSRTKIVEVKD